MSTDKPKDPRIEAYDERVNSLLERYWSESKSAARAYRWLKALTALGAVIVPVVTNLKLPIHAWQTGGAQLTATILSTFVAVAVVLEDVWKYRERHINYASRAVFLEAERQMFINQGGDYAKLDEQEAFKRFVERVESHFSADALALLKTTTQLRGNDSHPRSSD